MLKLVAVFEKDGVTPKANTYIMDYNSAVGVVFKPYEELEVGTHGLFYEVEGSGANSFRTSEIEAVTDKDGLVEVVTQNTVYQFETVTEDEEVNAPKKSKRDSKKEAVVNVSDNISVDSGAPAENQE